MNYAALLGVIAAAAFTLPGLALLAEALGLHRSAGVATSLGVALLTALGWFVRARRAGASAERERLPDATPTHTSGRSGPGLSGAVSSGAAELLSVKEDTGAQR